MSLFFASGGQSIGVSASTSVLPMNIQDRFPLGWTDWISLQSKGLSRVFSNTTVQKHQFFCAQLSLQSNSHQYMTTGKTIAWTRWTFVVKLMSLLFNMLPKLVITFLPRSKHLNFMAAITICSDFGAPQNLLKQIEIRLGNGYQTYLHLIKLRYRCDILPDQQGAPDKIASQKNPGWGRQGQILYTLDLPNP